MRNDQGLLTGQWDLPQGLLVRHAGRRARWPAAPTPTADFLDERSRGERQSYHHEKPKTLFHGAFAISA